ncbi:hypothetical protein [Amycolatopsis sp. RTGN1]|uniref:hypothetical protein n=1 Tax=Amycolatopsis ponsaeliensis TaxID=2992142 RepID=UPI00254D219A|nr:hypothetical protein [Amycolatopsis sp. RTGN1]
MTQQIQRTLQKTTNPIPEFTMGPQRQQLAPAVHSGVAPIKTLSSGVVRMACSHHAVPHIHEHSEITVLVVSGMVASLAGDQLEETFLHAPGSIMYIGPGVPHIGINLAPDAEATVFEVRTDRAFNDDVVRLPELDAIAAARVDQLQRDFELGMLTDQLEAPTASTALW